MKKYYNILLALSLSLLAAGCSPEMVNDFEKATLSIDIVDYSAGFVRASFEVDRDAFYLVGIREVVDYEDPLGYEKQFMTLALDSAYVKYLDWRYDLLYNGEQFVAPFSSHALNYGDTEVCFKFLKPNTEYMVFCFLVDVDKNKPYGSVSCAFVKTLAESNHPVHFDYRVDGYWDYAYPKDTFDNIISEIPWIAETIDSLTLVEKGVRVPGEYFSQRFYELQADPNSRVLFGIYAHENNGKNGVLFEAGHTYYTAFGGLDGPLKYYSIFRFHWDGPETRLMMTHEEDNTGGAW